MLPLLPASPGIAQPAQKIPVQALGDIKPFTLGYPGDFGSYDPDQLLQAQYPYVFMFLFLIRQAEAGGILAGKIHDKAIAEYRLTRRDPHFLGAHEAYRQAPLAQMGIYLDRFPLHEVIRIRQTQHHDAQVGIADGKIRQVFHPDTGHTLLFRVLIYAVQLPPATLRCILVYGIGMQDTLPGVLDGLQQGIPHTCVGRVHFRVPAHEFGDHGVVTDGHGLQQALCVPVQFTLSIGHGKGKRGIVSWQPGDQLIHFR